MTHAGWMKGRLIGKVFQRVLLHCVTILKQLYRFQLIKQLDIRRNGHNMYTWAVYISCRKVGILCVKGILSFWTKKHFSLVHKYYLMIDWSPITIASSLIIIPWSYSSRQPTYRPLDWRPACSGMSLARAPFARSWRPPERSRWTVTRIRTFPQSCRWAGSRSAPQWYRRRRQWTPSACAFGRRTGTFAPGQ